MTSRARIKELTQRMVEMYQAGMASRAIAAELGVNAGSVMRAVKKAGIRPRHMGYSELERFWTFVSKLETGCWRWFGNTANNGYGRFCAKGDRRYLAHRWSYEHFKGPIPDGMEIDHTCGKRDCVNPDHLEAVTHYENLRRAPGSIMNRVKRGEVLGRRKQQLIEKVMRAWPVCSPFVLDIRGGENDGA